MQINKIYHEAKEILIKASVRLNAENSKDKSYIGFQLNVLLDSLINQISHYQLTEKVSQKRGEQYKGWLISLTNKLLPR